MARMGASTGHGSHGVSAHAANTTGCDERNQTSLDDEIAHLRDLDLHGLRARWKSRLLICPTTQFPKSPATETLREKPALAGQV